MIRHGTYLYSFQVKPAKAQPSDVAPLNEGHPLCSPLLEGCCLQLHCPCSPTVSLSTQQPHLPEAAACREGISPVLVQLSQREHGGCRTPVQLFLQFLTWLVAFGQGEFQQLLSWPLASGQGDAPPS